MYSHSPHPDKNILDNLIHLKQNSMNADLLLIKYMSGRMPHIHSGSFVIIFASDWRQVSNPCMKKFFFGQCRHDEQYKCAKHTYYIIIYYITQSDLEPWLNLQAKEVLLKCNCSLSCGFSKTGNTGFQSSCSLVNRLGSNELMREKIWVCPHSDGHGLFFKLLS